MHEMETTEPADLEPEVDDTSQVDDVSEVGDVPAPSDAPAADPELDGFETDLDNVAAALDALDADDLDSAERLVAGLVDDAAPEADDA